MSATLEVELGPSLTEEQARAYASRQHRLDLRLTELIETTWKDANAKRQPPFRTGTPKQSAAERGMLRSR